MPFPGYKIYEEYNPEQYKTSVQKKVERVLGDAEKEKKKKRPESSAEFQEVMEREAEKLREFFGYDVEIPAIPAEVTPERYERWKEMGFELHYLPDEELAEERDLPGWKKKPGKRYAPDQSWGIEFFDEIKNGNLPKDSLKLPAAWVLADSREKPKYENGKQIYKEDALGTVLEELRKKKVITDFTVKGSRFNISWDELNKPEVKQAIAEALDVPPEALRLPRAIEWNYMGNVYHPEWGGTNTWEWFDDSYQKGQRRLYGGGSERGGLSNVYWFDPGVRSDDLGFRLQVVFSRE
jgi:hypothetical protein